jgi:hypothetical protein
MRPNGTRSATSIESRPRSIPDRVQIVGKPEAIHMSEKSPLLRSDSVVAGRRYRKWFELPGIPPSLAFNSLEAMSSRCHPMQTHDGTRCHFVKLMALESIG